MQAYTGADVNGHGLPLKLGCELVEGELVEGAGFHGYFSLVTDSNNVDVAEFSGSYRFIQADDGDVSQVGYLMPNISTFEDYRYVKIPNDDNGSISAGDYPGLAGVLTADMSVTQPSSGVGSCRDVATDGTTIAFPGYSSSTLHYTTDGITWNTRSLPESANWTGIAYGDGVWVASSLNFTTYVYTSTDMITWTQRSRSGTNLSNIIYAGGKFVAAPYLTSINQTAYSADGITWTNTTLPASANWQDGITYDGTYYVLTAKNTNIGARSTDLITWTQFATPVARQHNMGGCTGCIAYAGTDNALHVSTDAGDTWVSYDFAGIEVQHVMFRTDNKLIAHCNDASDNFGLIISESPGEFVHLAIFYGVSNLYLQYLNLIDFNSGIYGVSSGASGNNHAISFDESSLFLPKLTTTDSNLSYFMRTL